MLIILLEHTGPVSVEFDLDAQVPTRSVVGRVCAAANEPARSSEAASDESIVATVTRSLAQGKRKSESRVRSVLLAVGKLLAVMKQECIQIGTAATQCG